MVFPNFNTQSPFFDAFETNNFGQRANFYGRSVGLQPYQQSGLQNLFEPTFNKYLGALGQQVLGGQSPSMTWTDYLNQNYNPQREFLRQPQSQMSASRSVQPTYLFGR